ncbi:hypothetical protein H0H92_006723, partial [Tricholoma furcatifolium]
LDAYADPRIQTVSFSSAASRAGAEAYIDEKLKYHESIAFYCKRSRNALHFTCRFPIEILGTIFEEVATHDDALVLESLGSDERRLSWIQAVSHVCSHWRNVALRTPNLWANIPIESTEWAAEMLRRSTSTPLTLSYSYRRCRRERDEQILTMLNEVLSKESSRIQSLSVSLAAKMGSRLSDLVPFLHSAPLLEYLELHLKEDPREPQKILVLSSPLIRHLSLKRCSLAWDAQAVASTFSNLQVLEICDLLTSTKLSITQLLAILSQAPLIEYLSVVDGLADLEHPDQGLALRQTLTPVNLSLLKEILLNCDPCSSALLFDFLTFPGNVDSIRYSPMVSSRESPLEPVTCSMKSLGQRFGNAIDGMILQLMLSDGVHCWMSTPKKTTLSGAATLQIEPPPIWKFVRPIRDAFCQSLPLDQLSTLILKANANLTPTMWLFFGDLPNLEHVRVYWHRKLLTRSAFWRNPQGRYRYGCPSIFYLLAESHSHRMDPAPIPRF